MASVSGQRMQLSVAKLRPRPVPMLPAQDHSPASDSGQLLLHMELLQSMQLPAVGPLDFQHQIKRLTQPPLLDRPLLDRLPLPFPRPCLPRPRSFFLRCAGLRDRSLSQGPSEF